MKKIILTSLVASATILSANGSQFYFAPTLGKVIHEGSDLNEKTIYGYKVGIPIETKYGLDTLEIAHEKQKNVDYENSINTTKTNRFSGNFLKHYDSINNFTPYGLVGVGYESFSNKILDTHDGLFVNGGVGFKYKLNDTISFMTDVRHLININGYDNHTIFNVGIVFSCNNTKKNYPNIQEKLDTNITIPVEENRVIEPIIYVEPTPKDTDGDGVIDELDKCPDTKILNLQEGEKVDKDGCFITPKIEDVAVIVASDTAISEAVSVVVPAPIVLQDVSIVPLIENNTSVIVETAIVPVIVPPIDSDNDGVNDDMDRCLDTPIGFEVNSDGCEIVKNLIVNFDSNKKDIKDIYTEEIEKLVNFAKAFNDYKIKIIGHTDNTGNKKANQKLSLRRSTMMKEVLINSGIDSSRITITGYGEEKPIASNSTPEDKRENRRVEVILEK